eukprot:s212_g12.t1
MSERLRQRLGPALPLLHAASRWLSHYQPQALLRVGFEVPILQRLAQAHERLAEEVPAWRQLRELKASLDESLLAQAWRCAIASASNLGLGGVEFSRCQQQLAALRLQRPLCEEPAMQTVVDSETVDQARQLLTMLAQAGLEPGSAQWITALGGGKLHQQLQSLVEAEDQRLERLAAQRREVQIRLLQQERHKDLAVSDALRAAEDAEASAQRAREARCAAERAACLAIAEEVTCLSQSLQLCSLSDVQEERLRFKDVTLEDASDRCLVASERTKELRRLSAELTGPSKPRAPAALANASIQLAAVAEGLRQEPGAGVSLPSTEPPSPPPGPAEAATPASYAQLLRQAIQLTRLGGAGDLVPFLEFGALAREKLISSSLQAEIDAMRSLRGTGLLIS